ncbi:YjjG family noncanonical pyrimidine nucleotidase [Hyunsoonleella pacifica]|uniref:Noncanonical pyrimidine nucleotidase, YjjG family n=1 Tax=Hyunsoonleella pacifica TaxID=1080224 RepID=A0A4Q9FM77_9FLAO|nr:YjjG family noncanonical pyrimidine nucleotidase [Hyunsoonleella pacifica]TBN12432.1 noncanonical pyrimidine nucleotidase, YjjG family [Hyunsoonleella pacifica]GGD29547.1 noncanonical pyrimidine nucleotidase, YjjG family protein [Hyunsoonleella pacifica]
MKKFNNITDIFFDLDHTLWDFEKNSALTFKKIFEINNVEVDLNDFLEHYIPVNFKYWKLYREERIKKDELRLARLNETFQLLQLSIEEKVIRQLSEDYIKHLSTFNFLIEDTINILEYLKPNYRLHIITNGFSEVQHKKMDRSKIIHYFETITNSEIAGVKKPNPKIFNFALNLAKTESGRSIMIGDNLEADIEGALNIGMNTVFFNPNSTPFNREIKVISKLIELKQLL